MKSWLRILLLMMPIVLNVEIKGMYMSWQVLQVPIDRVLTNLERIYAANTNDVKAIYHLARIHSMAYATKPARGPYSEHEPSFRNKAFYTAA